MKPKMILAETRSGRPLTLWVQSPRNAYRSEWSAGQTIWMTPEEAMSAPGIERKNGVPVIQEAYSPYVSPDPDALNLMEGYTVRADWGEMFLDLSHVKWFYETCLNDPIVMMVGETQ